MEEATDVEMPSPKRMRVEEPEQLAASGKSESGNGFDDIHGDLPKGAEDIGGGVQPVKLPAGDTPSKVSQATGFLCDLPGLGVSKDDTVPCNGATNSVLHSASLNPPQDSTTGVEGATKDTDLPAELDALTKREKIVLSISQDLLDSGEGVFTANVLDVCGQRQESRERMFSETMKEVSNIANKAIPGVVMSPATEQDERKPMEIQDEQELDSAEKRDSWVISIDIRDFEEQHGPLPADEADRDKEIWARLLKYSAADTCNQTKLLESATIKTISRKLVDLEPEHEESRQAPADALSAGDSIHQNTMAAPIDDPLSFLEASLQPTTSRESEAHSIKAEPRGDATELDRLLEGEGEAQTFEHLATANKQNADAEFELDSSPLNSESDSSDDASSSDDDDAEDYEMLDPEEQARRLMAEDGGSDDDGGGKSKASGPLRTQNEKPDEDVPKPDVVVTEEMKIEELGSVEGTVENLVLIKAKTSGEYQVLEQGSVLCLEDRSVIGAIAETLGRVQQPYYSVRFANAGAISEAGILKDTRIFYVDQFATSVFTQPLKAFKGSDASNLHDEEVGDDELEFSDDEAEAEHKRRVKMQRQQKRMGRGGQSDGFSRGPGSGRGRGGSRGGRGGGNPYMASGGLNGTPELREQPPNPAEAALNYDDAGHDTNMERDDLYTPLARPTNLYEMMEPRPAPTESQRPHGNGDRGGHGRGRGWVDRGRGRGRGGDRGRGGRGGFGDRGGHTNHQSNGFQANGFPTLPTLPPQNQQGYNPYAAMPSHQQSYPQSGQQYPPQWNQGFPQPQFSSNPYQQQQQYPNSQQPPRPYPQPQFAADAAPSPNGIPPGAHINPLFFRQPQQQQPHHQQPWPPGGQQ